MSSAYECRKLPSLRLKPVDPALAMLLVTMFNSELAIFNALRIVGIIAPSPKLLEATFQFLCQNYIFSNQKACKKFMREDIRA